RKLPRHSALRRATASASSAVRTIPSPARPCFRELARDRARPSAEVGPRLSDPFFWLASIWRAVGMGCGLPGARFGWLRARGADFTLPSLSKGLEPSFTKSGPGRHFFSEGGSQSGASGPRRRGAWEGNRSGEVVDGAYFPQKAEETYRLT